MPFLISAFSWDIFPVDKELGKILVRPNYSHFRGEEKKAKDKVSWRLRNEAYGVRTSQ